MTAPILRADRSIATYSSAMPTAAKLSSPLHEVARQSFPSATLHGLTTFAPPSARRLVEVLDGASGMLVAINAEKIATGDPAVARLCAAHLGYPDGIGAVMALRRRGIRARRMPGADLWLAIIERYADTRSFYLIGGTDEVIDAVTRRLTADHPKMRIWSRNGFPTEADLGELETDLRKRKPDFVFVAMGSPRQEILMERLYAVQPALYVGLGGSFDIYAGVKTRAPQRLQAMGLEWAYRLVREPARLRRLPSYLRFVALLGTGRY